MKAWIAVLGLVWIVFLGMDVSAWLGDRTTLRRHQLEIDGLMMLVLGMLYREVEWKVPPPGAGGGGARWRVSWRSVWRRTTEVATLWKRASVSTKP